MWPQPGAAYSHSSPPQLSALPATQGVGLEQKLSDEEESALQQARILCVLLHFSDLTRDLLLQFALLVMTPTACDMLCLQV